MITRSKREDLWSASPFTVGPGSYDARKPNFKPRCGMAPFMSTQERQTLEIASVATPGPTDYNVNTSCLTVGTKRSFVFASKVDRMSGDKERQRAQDLPGPGSYAPELVRPVKLPNKPGSTIHSGSGINWVKVATAPSIPVLTQSYGYEEGRHGALVQQGSTDREMKGFSPGPGDYNPDINAVRPTGTLGFKFRSPHHPSTKEVLEVPGPGTYNTDVSKSVALKGGVASTRPHSMFSSTTLRSKLCRDAYGPGSFLPTSDFKSLGEHLASNPESFQAFGSSAKVPRSEPHRDDIPGPGSYFARSAIKTISDVLSSTNAFASKHQRFAALPNDVPGPGEYETVATSFTDQRKSRVGAFGSTAARFNRPPVLISTAAPGSYNVTDDRKNPVDVKRKDKRSSAFRSEAKRSDPAGSIQAPLIFYDAKLDWPKPSTTSTAFVSVVPRFGPLVADTPLLGPGAYQLKSPFDASEVLAATGSRFAVGPRFDSGCGGKTPGPGTYNTIPNMIKQTFNVTIGLMPQK